MTKKTPHSEAYPSTIPMSRNIRFSRLHQIFGILHIVLGVCIVVLEIAGLSVDYYLLGKLLHPATGIWTGAILILSGAIQFIAGKRESRGYLIAAFVLDIICITLMILGFALSISEYSLRRGLVSYLKRVSDLTEEDEAPAGITYNFVKAGVIAAICLAMLLTSIIHLIFVAIERVVCCAEQVEPEQGEVGGEIYRMYPQNETSAPTNESTPPTVVSVDNGTEKY